MIKLAIRRVKPGKESQLRGWMEQMNSRRSEVLETFRQEGVRHEQAYLLQTADGSILVYAMEAPDHGRAAAAFAQSALPIDLEHKRIMAEVLGDGVPSELLYECKADTAF